MWSQLKDLGFWPHWSPSCMDSSPNLTYTVSIPHIVKWHNRLPRGLIDKEPTCKAQDMGLILVLGRSHGTPLQYSCLENPMDRGAWWATVHGVAKSQTWLSDLNTLQFTLVLHSFMIRDPFLDSCFRLRNSAQHIASMAQEETVTKDLNYWW